MIIKGDTRYIPELSRLWAEVFGDDLEYIKIFFQKQYSRCETFITAIDGKIASVLYLMPCELDYDGEVFKGRYLYGAATKKEYRGRGLMNSLIKEAVACCKDEKIDYISLLPADEGLYSYYAKCGFHTAMYRYNISVGCRNRTVQSRICSDFYDLKNIQRLRASVNSNKIVFSCEELDYIISSITFYGSKVLCDDNKLIIYSEDDCVVNEFIGECNEMPSLEGFDTVYSPVPIEGIGANKKEKYGMIYPINEKLNDCSDIYMNLALD